MARSDYTEDELALLTPDEREALFDENDGAGDKPLPSNADGDIEEKLENIDLEIDNEADDKNYKDGADDPGEKKPDEQAANTEIDVDKNNADNETDGDDDPLKIREPEPKITPVLNADAPGDAQAMLDEIGTKKTDLAERFDNGDVTAREYQAELDALNREERKIENAVFKAELAKEMNDTSAKNAWDRTVSLFIASHNEYKTGSLRYNALDTMVKQIATDPANESLSGQEILEKAHEAVEKELGVVQSEKPADDKGKKQDKAKEKAEIPPTLGGLPAAAGTETETNRFTHLDRMAESDPQRYERELARLSPADRELYLSQ